MRSATRLVFLWCLALGLATKALAQTASFQIFSVDVSTRAVAQLTHLPAGYSAYNPALSPDGRRVLHDVVWSDASGSHQYVAVTRLRDGATTPLGGGIDASDNGKWSPDGEQVLYDLWVYPPRSEVLDLESGRKTFSKDLVWTPGWDPSGRLVVYQSFFTGDIHVMTLGGIDTDLGTVGAHGCMPTWSRRGGFILYLANCTWFSGTTLMVLPVTASGTARGAPYSIPLNGSWVMGNPTLSPDGQWVAFTGAVSGIGDYGIYRVPVSGGTPELLYGRAGFSAYDPWYSFDGRSIVFSTQP